MIVRDDDAIKRLNSPMNLINKLRSNGNGRNSAMQLFGIGRKREEEKISEEVTTSFDPFDTRTKPQTISLPQLPSILQIPTLAKPESSQAPSSTEPGLDNILENHESQIKLGLAHDNALRLLNNSIEALTIKLEDVKADKLPSVISAASKTVESIRKERSEAAKRGSDKEVHFHFYTPSQKSISDYEVIEVESQVQ